MNTTLMTRRGMRRWATVGAAVAVSALPSLVGAEAPAATSTAGFVPAVTSAAEPTSFVPVAPFRILDTRNGIGTGGETLPLGAGQTIDLQVAGVGPVPADAVGVVVNLTGTQTTDLTWVAAWPAGTDRQETSVLNLTPGVDAPNMVTALLGGGKLSLYNDTGTTHLVADAAGYLVSAGAAGTGPQGPQGPQGLPGPPGPAGPVGVADIEIVEVFGTAAPFSGGSQSAVCPVGKVVIAGGASSRNGTLRMYGSWPTTSTSWLGVFARDAGAPGSDTSASFAVYAVCATVG